MFLSFPLSSFFIKSEYALQHPWYTAHRKQTTSHIEEKQQRFASLWLYQLYLRFI